MHYSTLSMTLLSLISLSSAVPTPVELAPRCGTTITPTFLQQLSEANPVTVEPNTISTGGDFLVSQSVNAGNIVNRVYQVVGFENIPAGSYACSLEVTFPANYAITSSGNPILNVTTLYKDNSAAVTYPNDLSWSKLFPPTSPPYGQGLFGTVTFTPGTTQVINSENCPAGGGNLAFVFSVAGWVGGAASVDFKEYVNAINGAGLAGVYLTHNC